MNIRPESLREENKECLLEFLISNKDMETTFNPHPFTLEAINFLLQKTKDQFILFFVEETVVGYGLLQGWDAGYVVPSLGIAVDRLYRGTEVSKYIMNYLHLLARIKGSNRVRLTVKKDNIAAINLYKNFGYILEEFPDMYIGVLDL